MEHDLLPQSKTQDTTAMTSLTSCKIIFMLRKQTLSFTPSSLTVTLNPKYEFLHVPRARPQRAFISVWHESLGFNWRLSGQT